LERPIKNRSTTKLGKTNVNPKFITKHQNLVDPQGLTSFFTLWTSPILMALGLLFIFNHFVQWGELIIALAILLKINMGIEGQHIFSLRNIEKWVGPLKTSGLLCLFWFSFSALMMFLPRYDSKFSFLKVESVHVPALIFLFLWTGMALAFRSLPLNEWTVEISSRTSRIWLGFLLVMGALLRLYHTGSFMGTYDESYLSNWTLLQSIAPKALEQNTFNLLTTPWDPFYNFFTAVIIRFFPNEPIVWLQRLTLTAFDLATIWILYLLGKEMAGRRVGLFAAAIAVVSQGLLSRVVFGTGAINNPLILALVLLFLLRMIKKPNLRHFFQWGIATSLIVYSFSYFPAFTLFIIFGVLIWIYLACGKFTKIGLPVTLLVMVTSLLAWFVFVVTNHYCSNDNLIVHLLNCSDSLIPCVVIAAIFVLSVFFIPRMAIGSQDERWLGWLSGTWLCLIFSYPILIQDTALAQRNYYFWRGLWAFNPSYLSKVYSRLGDVFDKFFVSVDGSSSGTLNGDPYLGYWEAILVFLGLAYCIARLDWKKATLLFTACLGVSAYLFSGEAVGGRFLNCLVPLYVISGLGLDALLRNIHSDFNNRVFLFFVWVLLLSCFAWAVQGVMFRIYS